MAANYSLLNQIYSPFDVKKLSDVQLVQLCKELRQFIIDEESCNPAHFGANLGVVELTVALHSIYETPTDKIIWDVGHQAYSHKILTGRREIFHTNRKLKGISGFPTLKESEHDCFGVGHSSTSISAALGMAKAFQLSGENHRKVVAVIGDGSMTSGLAFEGMNNAGIEKTNILVILNDNHIAIDPNVGALSEYLLDIVTSKTYNKVRDEIWNILGKLKRFGPNSQNFIQKIESGLKTIVLKQSNLFEALNFRYFGPIDGHDVNHLTKVLKDLKDLPGPKLLHCLTLKGKGFKPAELNQTVWHAPSGCFDKNTGKIIVSDNILKSPKFQDVFGHTLVELAEKNPKIVGITPAMPTGCSMTFMMEKFPERSFDVGIAEQHAVTFAAGLASQGFVPFCNIYSSFSQRAYDQIIHDVALQKLNVILCLDRAGLVGADGATHHGAFDIAFLRCVPDLIISAPMDEEELRNLMFTAQLEGKGTFVIRYPRGNGILIDWKRNFKEIPVGKARILSEGKDIAILSVGAIGNEVVKAREILETEGICVSHYDMRFVKPLDKSLLHRICNKFEKIVTVEDGCLVGGFGSAILEFINENEYSVKVKRLGIPDKFIEHGTQAELYKLCEYDATAIYETVKNWLKISKIESKKQFHYHLT